jgi:hypothetical protein
MGRVQKWAYLITLPLTSLARDGFLKITTVRLNVSCPGTQNKICVQIGPVLCPEGVLLHVLRLLFS